MKKTLFILLVIPLSILSQSTTDEKQFIDRIGLGTSLNAVADEGVWGIDAFLEKDIFTWENGRVYAGLGIFYGSFKVTNPSTNQYIDGKATLIQPILLQTGHQFVLINKRLLVRTGFAISPSIFNQKMVIDDNRYGLNNTYSYSNFKFTMHAKTGLAIRVGEKNSIEIYSNLPVINRKIAPLGLGLGVTMAL